MPDGLYVVCTDCEDEWGPYNGTAWTLPREQAQRAVNGLKAHGHDPEVTAHV